MTRGEAVVNNAALERGLLLMLDEERVQLERQVIRVTCNV